MFFSRLRRTIWTWIVLAAPLIAINLWVLCGIGYFRPGQFIGNVLAVTAWCALLVLATRWRVLRAITWIVAWLFYLVVLALTLAEALSFFFQGSSFNLRFFANLRWDNLRPGLYAFPVLSGITGLLLLVMLAASAWLLARQTPLLGRNHLLQRIFKGVVLAALLAIACALPSAAHRLGDFVWSWNHAEKLVFTGAGHAIATHLNDQPPARDQIYARPGKNLVIIYMESLERIYTDNQIFPGLTPNLNRWRAKGIDFPGYLTYTGANFTIAGIFASQCGVPYLPSPERALDLGGNDANASGFQPTLACLGDVLHAAGYEQTFMNGVDLSFAADGTFFHLHGFDDVLGLNQLERSSGDRLPQPGWGLYDSDLLRLAAGKFETLAASGDPFNLDVLTVDNHPPHGRPSPGCPKYAANDNDTLQSVHCTDYLVGKFLDTISENPAFKNTIVVLMSDHQSMPNDAWPLYPKEYKRRPLLFILNGGQGLRDMRFYHMDITPTVLHLMDVKTNAKFIAGADRSEAKAPGSPLVDDATDVAVLRKILWARVQPIKLCAGGVLIGAADNGVRIGGYQVPLSWRGSREAGLWPHGAWVVAMNRGSVHGEVLHHRDGSGLDGPGVDARRAAREPDESMLLIEPEAGADVTKQLSIDWIGVHGGRTHLADVPRLRDLDVSSPQCSSLLTRMNALPAGQTLDLSSKFDYSTAPLYPPLKKSRISFDKQNALPYEREVGWLRPEIWGSFTVGNYAKLGFTLPRDHCHAMAFDFKVHPYFAASRSKLDVGVYANGALMTTWHLEKQDSKQTWRHVAALVRTADPKCKVDLRFVFNRPGAPPPPYPKDEDRRPIQLLFLSMDPVAASSSSVAAQ